MGLDIKYPLTTTLTGVATMFPDFQTIEQDVTSINFSYTEKLLTDRRPFFAEGAGFLPYQDLFYSRRIGVLDGGLKVAGKQGDTSVGLLATDTRGTNAQNAAVLDLSQDLGLYSRATLNFVSDIEPGQPSNQVAKFEGQYGWRVGPDQWTVIANHTPSWQGGRRADSKDYFNFSTTALPGHPTFNVDYQDIGPNFIQPGLRPGRRPEGQLGQLGAEQSVRPGPPARLRREPLRQLLPAPHRRLLPERRQRQRLPGIARRLQPGRQL